MLKDEEDVLVKQYAAMALEWNYAGVESVLDSVTRTLLNEDEDMDCGGWRFEMEVCHQVYGVVPKDGKIRFAADGDNAIPFDAYYSVVIRGGRLIAKRGVSLNSCNYRRSNRQ